MKKFKFKNLAIEDRFFLVGLIHSYMTFIVGMIIGTFVDEKLGIWFTFCWGFGIIAIFLLIVFPIKIIYELGIKETPSEKSTSIPLIS